MIQYLKLEDQETLASPVEMCGSKKVAQEVWGKFGFVACEIDKKDDPSTFELKLKNKKVVFNEEKRKAHRDKKDPVKLSEDRTTAIREVLKSIDADNFDINKLSPLELKCMFGISGGPTDEELGIE